MEEQKHSAHLQDERVGHTYEGSIVDCNPDRLEERDPVEAGYLKTEQ